MGELLIEEALKWRRRLEIVEDRLCPIWVGGRNPTQFSEAERHWTLQSSSRPVSIGQLEGLFLYYLLRLHAPTLSIEIGTGFGYSTLWIAAGSSSRVLSIDNLSEGQSGEHAHAFANWGRNVMKFEEKIEYVIGESPAAFTELMVNQPADFAFIDGDHHGNQPLVDFKAVQDVLSDKGIVILHDLDSRYDVWEAFAYGVDHGMLGMALPTSCRMGVLCRRREELCILNEALSYLPRDSQNK